ncbi:putative Proteasome subunit beta type-6 [Monocercomonoides exilis]|uniref:putative Proteasome subunit beta type-6 n=1 Tax=Monocercomonoides exilis TaxID=2049356 RepID=UPI003559744F|nr:putative Proteasome subunit beta type-6 [Monocercomonoides exilis]|eukprot:MONOS_16787.1-p1 / transcript=MONOS_16787.1 / gene=MONOS_16787 / organism=Monocercomonoides_exilis_PA203 / gene_product=Proteasome subunit beta type-6 / transcript_product=Proteasome subunit beta type-6 / location=Mono_scaffold00475:24822-25920(+) / protein_length=219 / sequence_SO=supercontig / SO=protein_coding / is_pseudo=false
MDFEGNDYEGPVSTGTTIMALKFAGGLLLAADSRTSLGSFIANRMSDKITPVFEDIYVCRSGSSADTQTVTAYANYSLTFNSMELGRRPSVKTAACVLRDLCYTNKKVLSAAFLCAGLDGDEAHIYSIPLGGALIEAEHYAASGSGSTYVLTFLDKHFKSGMSLEECKDLAVKACSLAMFRDNSSGGCIRLCILQPGKPVVRELFKGDQVPSFFPTSH